MRCGRQLCNVRTPHRISADVSISKSAHTGFAGVNTASFWTSDLNTAKSMDLRILLQRKFGFADLNTAKNRFADLKTAKFWDLRTLIQGRKKVHHTGFLRT